MVTEGQCPKTDSAKPRKPGTEQENSSRPAESKPSAKDAHRGTCKSTGTCAASPPINATRTGQTKATSEPCLAELNQKIYQLKSIGNLIAPVDIEGKLLQIPQRIASIQNDEIYFLMNRLLDIV